MSASNRPGQKRADCTHMMAAWDNHPLCPSCRLKGPAPCEGPSYPCVYCQDWSTEMWDRFFSRRTNKRRKAASAALSVAPSPSGDVSGWETPSSSPQNTRGSLSIPMDTAEQDLGTGQLEPGSGIREMIFRTRDPGPGTRNSATRT